MDDWDRIEAELLADPATRAAYDARRPAYELASKVIRLRAELGLSQRELAKRAHMTQPEIARIESGSVQPTWETVSRLLSAVGADVNVRLRTPAGKVVRFNLVKGSP
jgi:predicted transcriptional regulator